MAAFPALKTGAVAQYGSSRSRRFSTKVVRFVDGSAQRFSEYSSVLRSWAIRLDLLDEAELAQLQLFFSEQEGRAGMFSFTDPWDGTVYSNCSFGEDMLAAEFGGNGRGKTMLTIKENRA